jgi:hypothetical protein
VVARRIAVGERLQRAAVLRDGDPVGALDGLDDDQIAGRQSCHDGLLWMNAL